MIVNAVLNNEHTVWQQHFSPDDMQKYGLQKTTSKYEKIL